MGYSSARILILAFFGTFWATSGNTIWQLCHQPHTAMPDWHLGHITESTKYSCTLGREIRQDDTRHDFGNDIQPPRLHSSPPDAHMLIKLTIFRPGSSSIRREMPKLLCMQNRPFSWGSRHHVARYQISIQWHRL